MVHVIDETHRTRGGFNMFVIYITEAHAADVWPIGLSAGTINYKHKDIKDRIGYIEKFVKEHDLAIPIFADNMDNQFETEYAAWPFRYYCIENGKIVNIAQPEDSTFDIGDLFNLLDSY